MRNRGREEAAEISSVTLRQGSAFVKLVSKINKFQRINRERISPGTKTAELGLHSRWLWASKLGSGSLTQSLEGLENKGGLPPRVNLNYSLSTRCVLAKPVPLQARLQLSVSG